jgi:glutaredoxin
MEFQGPAATGYTVYSKNNCKYCDMVKELLEEEEPTIINTESYVETRKDEFLTFIAALARRSYKTFPMVFHNGIFIGGFIETLHFMKKQ